MNAGAKLPFLLERRGDVPDGAGGVVPAWSVRGTLWGVLRARGGRERMAGAVGVAAASHVVRVRGAAPGAPSRPGIRDRLRIGARVFEIVAVVEVDALGRSLDCHVTEEVAA